MTISTHRAAISRGFLECMFKQVSVTLCDKYIYQRSVVHDIKCFNCTCTVTKQRNIDNI